MDKNITHTNGAPQITDFFRNQTVSHFCQCGKVLAKGSIACMPDNTAEPLVIGIEQNGQRWQPVMIDPRNGSIVTGSRWHDSPCSALRHAANWSAQDETAIALDSLEGNFDWRILVRRISAELANEGAEMAAAWRARQASGDKRQPVTVGMHPIKLAAYESANAADEALVWDVAEFDAHVSAEVA